uniref:Uncharacterized protein n=1 Tax=Nelumbo nucifera TaxID=4432 RepID=A0A822YC15_NELNU|nr:TPA_asm: hypothetical protein HUJ06_031310 [Nelumbo nucifera]
MEPAKIDWKNIDSRFVEDELYEHINAPKWVDLSAPDEHVDDEAWFCRPECRHPKIAEDFLRSTPTSKAKHLRSISVSEILPLGDRNRKDANLKRRGLIPSSASSPRILKSDTTTPSKPPRRFQQDIENNNPNFSSPLQNYEAKIKKAAIKSSTERKKLLDDSPSHADTSQNDRYPQLKSTLSARNLFAGRDILNQITEFCNELKKLAMRAKEREKLEKSNAKKNAVDGEKSDQTCGGRGEESEKEKEKKKPLLGAEKENSEATEKSNGKEKQQKRPRK